MTVEEMTRSARPRFHLARDAGNVWRRCEEP